MTNSGNSRGKSNERELGAAIRELFKAYRLDTKLHQVAIREMWEKVMGKTIMHYTSDLRLQDGTLFLTLSSAPLKQDLQFKKDEIIGRINEEFDEVVVRALVIR